MLLNYDEFQKLGGSIPDEKQYQKLERDAENLINPITNFFYEENDIASDTDAVRVKYFKKAMYLQIQYTFDIGASTTYEMAEKNIKSVSIDGTSVSTGTSPTDSATDGIYNLAMDYLYKTGLLYRGITSC